MHETDDEPRDDYSDDAYAVEAVRVAKAVLDGSMSVFAGCSELSHQLWNLCVDDEKPFSLIREIAGKLHEYPRGVDRHLWNRDVRARKEAELAEWLPLIKSDVFAACREIVRRFGADTKGAPNSP